MKKQTFYLVLLLSFLFSSGLFSQGFITPAEDNAIVYFIRTSSVSSATTYEYFHNKEFIGVFKAKNYMRYELPAGKQLLWISWNNKEFLDCDLKAGGTYFIQVKQESAGFIAKVALNIITADSRDFMKCKKLVMKKKPVITSEKTKQEIEKKLEAKDFANHIMERYNEEWKYTEHNQTVTPDMAIPAEMLQ